MYCKLNFKIIFYGLSKFLILYKLNIICSTSYYYSSYKDHNNLFIFKKYNKLQEFN